MKKIMSKILVVTVVLSILVPTIVFANESQFSDITNHWGKNNIETLVSMGLISGFPDGTFRPDKTISNAEFIAIAYKAMEKLKLELNSSVSLSLKGNRNPGTTSDPNYKPEHWASAIHSYMAWHELGGEDFTREELDEPITRYAMAKILIRMLNEFKEPYTQTHGVANLMSDYQTVYNNKKYAGHVEQAFMKGIISGKAPEGRFDGEATGTRAEASAMVLRAIDKSKRIDVVVMQAVPRTKIVLNENDSTVGDVLNLNWEKKDVIKIGDHKKQFEMHNGILTVTSLSNIRFDDAIPVKTFTEDEWVSLPNFTYKGIEYETIIGESYKGWLSRKTPLEIYLADPKRPLVPIDGDTVIDSAGKSKVLKVGASGVLGENQGIDYYSGITFDNGYVFKENDLGTSSMGFMGAVYKVDPKTGESHFYMDEWVEIIKHHSKEANNIKNAAEGQTYGNWFIYVRGQWYWTGPIND